jgi:hypothetical protein
MDSCIPKEEEEGHLAEIEIMPLVDNKLSLYDTFGSNREYDFWS